VQEYELLVKRSVLTAIANLSISVAPIVLLPLLTKTLSIEDYGIWTLIVVTTSLLPMIVLLGLPNAMIRFLASSKEAEEIREGYYSMGLLVLCADLAVSLVLLLFAQSIAAYLLANNYAIAFLLPAISFFASYNYLPLSYCRTFQQAKRYSLISTLQAIFFVVFVALFVLLGFGLVGAALGLLITQALVSAVSSYFVISDIGFTVPKLTRAKEFLSYSLPFVPRDMSTWALNVSDRYIIGFFLGFAWVGYYSPGYTLGSAITLLAGPFTIVLPAVIYQHYDASNIVQVRTLIQYSVKYFLAAAIPSAFLVSVLSKPILAALSTAQIAANGYLITPFIALGAVFFGLYAIMIIVLTFEKKTRVIGTMWISAAGLNIGLNLVLVPYFGILAAAVTTLLAYAFILAVTAFYSAQIVRFSVDVPFILKSVLASILISIIAVTLHVSGLLSLTALIATCAVIYAAILYALRGFAPSEITFFRSFLTRGR
jgi:O-antigen/teichoic acid export membrane protein